MVAGLPEQNIRIISPDLGGGFGNKVPIYPGYVVATAASLLIGKPVKWVETPQREPHLHRLRPRLPHEGRAGAHQRRPDPRRCGSTCSPTRARSTPTRSRRKFRAGLFHVVTGSYDYPAAHIEVHGRVHEQGAGRRRLPLLVPHHRGVVPHRAARADRGLRARHRPRRDPVQELHPARAVPVRDADRVRLRLRRLPDRAAQGARRGRLREAARGAGRGARRGPAASASASPTSPRRSAPARRRPTTSPA